MLVLTRKLGEAIVIGQNVTVTVLGVQGGRVRLGFNAPLEASIHRAEVRDRIAGAQPGLRLADCS